MAASQASKKILVVDDSRTIRQVAESILMTEGCEVTLAENGYEALSVIKENEFDLVFMDIMMPRLDGFQTCVLLKSNDAYKSLPIIMLSSKDGAFDRARGKLMGSEEYLTKPFTRTDIIDVVNKYVFQGDNA